MTTHLALSFWVLANAVATVVLFWRMYRFSRHHVAVPCVDLGELVERVDEHDVVLGRRREEDMSFRRDMIESSVQQLEAHEETNKLLSVLVGQVNYLRRRADDEDSEKLNGKFGGEKT